MLTHSYTNITALPDDVFVDILHGMRSLYPPCGGLGTAQAGQDNIRVNMIDTTIIHLLKDCGQKLAHTLLTKGGGHGTQTLAITLQDVAINAILLLLGALLNGTHIVLVQNVGQAP